MATRQERSLAALALLGVGRLVGQHPIILIHKFYQ